MPEISGASESRSSGLSLLGLFHPEGVAGRWHAVGGSCPEALAPARGACAGDLADLIVLAPTSAECRRTGWVSAAVAALDQQLAADGVVYVLAPPPWRTLLRRLLSERGLALSTAFLHLPDVATSRYVIPLTRTQSRYAVSDLTPNPRWKRLSVLMALRLGAPRVAAEWWPSVGFTAHRPSDRPPFDWLGGLGPDGRDNGLPIITISGRGERVSAVLHRFRGEEPSSVVKVVGRDRRTPGRGEAAALAALGPAAARAGVRVPAHLSSGYVGGHPAFVQTALSGRTAAVLLRYRPERVSDLLDRVTTWLEAWNRSTRHATRQGESSLASLVLDRAAGLMRLLDDGAAYARWFAGRCAELDGVVPLVSTHDDLTTWNVLLDGDRVGIVDWEVARDDGLPLTDFFYAAVDAVVMASGGPRPSARTRALQECIAPRGRYRPIVLPRLHRLRRALDLPEPFTDLGLHACFLAHAANELSVAPDNGPRPFLEVVQWLALNRDEVRHWVGGNRS